MNIRAIVPVKPLKRAKSRLTPILSPAQRETLSRVMLTHTLETLKQVRSIHGILVVTRDTAAIALARDHGVHTLQEGSTPSLVASVTFATQFAIQTKADGVLVVSSDIPFLQVSDFEQMVAYARNSTAPQTVVIAPDKNLDGTNALLVAPPGGIPYRFGVGSYSGHLEEAKKVGATVHVYRSPTLALDIDVPSDFREYMTQLKKGLHRHAADIRSSSVSFDQLGFAS